MLNPLQFFNHLQFQSVCFVHFSDVIDIATTALSVHNLAHALVTVQLVDRWVAFRGRSRPAIARHLLRGVHILLAKTLASFSATGVLVTSLEVILLFRQLWVLGGGHRAQQLHLLSTLLNFALVDGGTSFTWAIVHL